MEEPAKRRRWSGFLVAMVGLVILLMAGMISLGILDQQEQSKIQTLSSQVSYAQTQLSNLQSQNSNLQARISNQSTYITQYEKMFSILMIAWTCTSDSDLILTLTNFGSQAVVVPASGVKILAPNGSTYLPTPAIQITFHVFNANVCLAPPSISATTQTSVTVPPRGEASMSIAEASLLWIAPSGNYVITFSGVTTASGGQVSVNPLLISWAGPVPSRISISYNRFSISGPAGTIFLQNKGWGIAQPYQATLSYGNVSCSENYFPTPYIAPGSGQALMWSYSSGDPCPNTQATSGEAYSGTVLFSSGTELLYTGTFQP